MDASGSSSHSQDDNQIHKETEDLDCMFAFSDPLGKSTWQGDQEEVGQKKTLLSLFGAGAQIIAEMILHTHT